MNLKAWLKEPLTHFLVAGALLFFAMSWLAPQDESGRVIHVDREDLLVFMQGRAQVYDEETFNALLDEMPAEQREELVAETALQEALYREAQSLGLADSDPLIRQRMVQQMRLLLVEEAAADMQVSEAEAREFYDANRDRYRREPELTFSHAFFAGDDGRARAMSALAAARSSGDGEIGDAGDRFLYQRNYTGVDRQLVSSHLGEAFADALFGLDTGTWAGPIQSEHGWHLVLPVSRSEVVEPAFEDIAAVVTEDALADKRAQAGQQALDRLMERYRVDFEGGAGL